MFFSTVHIRSSTFPLKYFTTSEKLTNCPTNLQIDASLSDWSKRRFKITATNQPAYSCATDLKSLIQFVLLL